ncbi:hypothetical protein GW17_00007370 [Ensete ventricosum]|nr:hypothetical protein GW17_00007370 [Ensete ventricosum]
MVNGHDNPSRGFPFCTNAFQLLEARSARTSTVKNWLPDVQELWCTGKRKISSHKIPSVLHTIHVKMQLQFKNYFKRNSNASTETKHVTKKQKYQEAGSAYATRNRRWRRRRWPSKPSEPWPPRSDLAASPWPSSFRPPARSLRPAPPREPQDDRQNSPRRMGVSSSNPREAP